MQTFGNFIQAKAYGRGVTSISAIAEAAGVSRDTVYAFADARDETVVSHLRFASRMGIATAAGYPDWDALVAAWRSENPKPGEENWLSTLGEVIESYAKAFNSTPAAIAGEMRAAYEKTSAKKKRSKKG